MKKRFLAAVLALVMTAACMTACGGENKTEDKQQTTTTTTAETTTTTEKETGVIDTTTTLKVTTAKDGVVPPSEIPPDDVNPGYWHEDSETTTTTTKKATTTTTTTTKAATTTKPKPAATSEAERIAKLIVENESTWHRTGRISDIHKYGDTKSTTCWFEDLDFDGVKEFVVGPVCAERGQATFYGYDIYKIENNKLRKLKSAGDPTGYCSYSSISFGKYNYFENNNLEMYLYKDGSGKYHYAHCALTSWSFEECMVLNETDFSVIKDKPMFDYLVASDPAYYSVGGSKVSADKMISRVKAELNGAKQCTVKTKQVNITNKNGKITSDCYSKKKKEEKIRMLAESYDAYKIVESNKQPDFLVFMLNRIKK